MGFEGNLKLFLAKTRGTKRFWVDFTTSSFGHATSGVACAALMFQDYFELTGDPDIEPHLERALGFCMSMQFTNPADPNLAGCILEKIKPPDGTDASPYHIRDLGTIFFIQALSRCPMRIGFRID